MHARLGIPLTGLTPTDCDGKPPKLRKPTVPVLKDPRPGTVPGRERSYYFRERGRLRYLSTEWNSMREGRGLRASPAGASHRRSDPHKRCCQPVSNADPVDFEWTVVTGVAAAAEIDWEAVDLTKLEQVAQVGAAAAGRKRFVM